MDRREVSRLFRGRLTEAMERAGASRAALARRVGIDRSTLTQLLSTEVDRLPRADTVAAIAAELKVSLDWLLGLSQVNKLGADILHESLQVAPSAQEPVDEQIIEWFEEASGTKVRSVPATLPDFSKTAEVLRHEYRVFSARSLDRALGEARDKLTRLRLADTDMEICMPLQGLEDFADLEGAARAGAGPADRAAPRSGGGAVSAASRLPLRRPHPLLGPLHHLRPPAGRPLRGSGLPRLQHRGAHLGPQPPLRRSHPCGDRHVHRDRCLPAGPAARGGPGLSEEAGGFRAIVARTGISHRLLGWRTPIHAR